MGHAPFQENIGGHIIALIWANVQGFFAGQAEKMRADLREEIVLSRQKSSRTGCI